MFLFELSFCLKSIFSRHFLILLIISNIRNKLIDYKYTNLMTICLKELISQRIEEEQEFMDLDQEWELLVEGVSYQGEEIKGELNLQFNLETC